jgi:regulator of RNase E activity RraA
VNMNQHLPRLDSEALEKLGRASTATLATQLFKLGLRQQFLVGVTPVHRTGQGFVGEAFTMRFIPAREDLDTLDTLPDHNNLQWTAVESLQHGQVLVTDSRSDIRAASAGDMLIARAMHRGAAAFVTDGAVRDGRAIADLPFPTYAQAVTATTRLSYFHVADLQRPIGCAGVAVYPGDVLVGDHDGVIVVPRYLAPKIADSSVEQEEIEDYLHRRVLAGEALWGVYPPNAQTIADYASWREAQGKPPAQHAHPTASITEGVS